MILFSNQNKGVLMESKTFKHHLIRKLVVGGVFFALTIGAIVAINIVNEKVIAPNEGFITAALCKVDTGGAKNSMGDRLAVEIEQEGIVLAKNATNEGEEKPVLPLDKSVKHVNVFGFDTIQWIISDSGSGMAGPGSSQKSWDLLNSLEAKGITYNQEIINYYKGWNKTRADLLPDGRGGVKQSYSYTYGSSEYKNLFYRLTNPSLSNNADYKTVYDTALGDETDTAIVVIGRWGGEHLDPPHEQINNEKAKKTTNPNRGYLEITEEEEELLTAVGQDYSNVIVIINSTNVMQMDFMEKIPGLDACLIVGPTGTQGAKAIPQIMWGEINPSGRTADTWPMNHRYNPAYYTMGNWGDKGACYTDVPSNCNLSKNNEMSTANFADYIEGVYVGYKWYETADEENYWANMGLDYADVVAYPFGHGLSYTTFKWELVDTKPSANSNINAYQDIEVQVKVTNTGNRSGRDVVELYLTAPYREGEIEKASVSLVGFQKTKTLVPGESEIVTITLKARDFLSFDCYDKNGNDHAGWELDKGTYEVKMMTSCHEMKEGVEPIRFNVPDIIDLNADPDTGNESRPLFTGDDAIDGISMDGESIGEDVNYLTRENFDPLLEDVNPKRKWNSALEVSPTGTRKTAYSTDLQNEWDNATEDAFGNQVPVEEPLFDVDNGLKVLDEKYQLTEAGMQLAQDYDDPLWDDLLDQLKWTESTNIVKDSSYKRPGIKSLGLKNGTSGDSNADYYDAEGASQVGADLDGGRRLTAYPMPTLQAQCWNDNMTYLFGLSEAKDMSIGGKDALYGPASNIHRHPYGGRNAEYHSEDGFLAGHCLANVTKGLADGGKQGFIKHFCMNDTEYHRVGLYVWGTEQALREIYLRPFEQAIKFGEDTALMTSFNRIGAVWTGGSQALVQGILRNEWGFKGMLITDYTENRDLQDANQQFRAGGNYILGSSNFKDPGQDKASIRLQWRVRENAKQVIYGSIRPLYTNYVYNSDDSHKAIISSLGKAPWVWWKPLLNSAEGAVIVAFALITVIALVPTNPEFRAHLFKKNKKEEAE